MPEFNELSIVPHELERLPNPPKRLFYAGDVSLLAAPKVAIVGSRRASVYTKECVTALAGALKNAGVCVVSGGALGVDIAAHKGAMPRTIGVFGTGLGVLYPSANANFIREIYARALALSEYEADEGVGRNGCHFLQRNRIVVALSQALIVAQADERSGSMQSARIARELGVPIFTFPQRLGDSDSTNKLLSEGAASLICDFNEFAAKFGVLDAALPQADDEILKFCGAGIDLDAALAKFGEKIYEYELEGRVEIKNLRVRAVK